MRLIDAKCYDDDDDNDDDDDDGIIKDYVQCDV